MIGRDEIPFAPIDGHNAVLAPRHAPGRWQPASYAEQEAAKVPRHVGAAPIETPIGAVWVAWSMCRNDASMHRYRVNGPFWWVAMYYGGAITVHLFDTEAEARWIINHRRRWRRGLYVGHGRVRFKT